MGLEPVSVYHMEICKIRCEAARAEGDRAGLEESLVRRSASDPSYQDSGRSSADLTTPARPSRLHRVFSTAANLCSNCLRILHSWRQVQILMFGCRHYPPSSRVQFCWIPLKSNLASCCVPLSCLETTKCLRLPILLWNGRTAGLHLPRKTQKSKMCKETEGRSRVGLGSDLHKRHLYILYIPYHRPSSNNPTLVTSLECAPTEIIPSFLFKAGKYNPIISNAPSLLCMRS